MKEVNIIPDDAKSAESLKQLEQVVKFDSISYRMHMLLNIITCSICMSMTCLDNFFFFQTHRRAAYLFIPRQLRKYMQVL